jgi:hypothetical protein
MIVKGILVEANDGSSYLLGIGPRSTGAQAERPTIWRVDGATYESLEESRSASRTIREEFDLQFSLHPRKLTMNTSSRRYSRR